MNKSVENKKYFEYLKKRSTLGMLYHNYFLYPKLSSYLHGNILDFGCGIGGFLKFHSDTIGVDINPDNIAYCGAQGIKAELLQDGRIPFTNAYFSSIVMDNVIEHIPQNEINSVLSEILRVLQDGGIFLIGVPGEKGYASDSDHKHYYNENNLVNLLASFNCIRKKTLHMPFYFPHIGKYLRQYCIYIIFEKCLKT